MLRIEKLILNNFGVYYGTSTLTLPYQIGVTVIWGNNGHGKTTIMNAFRYVLWGELYGRNRRILPPVSFVNTDAIVEGKNMLVELYMQHNGIQYIVSRGLKRKGGSGYDELDYENIFQVKQGSNILSNKEATELLSLALPKSISRFYLFDAELLGEYEDLLDESNQEGQKIKDSIEAILGMPILLNGRDIFEVLITQYNQAVAKASQNNETTKAHAESLNKLNEKLENLKSSEKDLKNKLEKFIEEKNLLTDQMAQSLTYSKLLGERNAIEEGLSMIHQELADAQKHLTEEADEAWRTILNDILDYVIEHTIAEIEPIENKKKKLEFERSVNQYIREQLLQDNNHCPVCKNNIDSTLLSNISARFSATSVQSLTQEEKDFYNKTQEQIAFMRNSYKEDRTEWIKNSFKSYESLLMKLRLQEVKLSQKNKEISSISSTSSEQETNILALPKKLEQCETKISEVKKGLSLNADSKAETLNGITRVSAMLKKILGGADLETALNEKEFVESIHKLFSDGIDSFRSKLKESVEKDATTFFRSISHQQDFESLAINDNFGMNIVKTDGTFVPNRSSGYEQVVAISLISALHKNAPIEGPVFMDSTFQRIDPIHKMNTLKSLPLLGNQVIVLAFQGEIGDLNGVREKLGSNLIQEYTINQISSSYSELVKS